MHKKPNASSSLRARRLFGLLALLPLSLVACGGVVTEPDDDGSFEDGDGFEDGGDDGAGDDDDGGTYGTPCEFLHGTVSLKSWGGNQEDGSYNESLYSFELATKDIEQHYNDGDLLYVSNMFSVVTVVDDESFIVDLGDVGLTDVPGTVDPANYPTGNWGEHDYIQAVLDHTYVVRSIDGNTRQWAAFRVVGLAPGVEVTIEWIRSPDSEVLVVPIACL